MNILALDPGTFETGYAFFCDGKWHFGVENNDEMLKKCAWFNADVLAIEMIASYGMPVGAEVFETCVWIGRFEERYQMRAHIGWKVLKVYRKDVKMHLCGTTAAKDAHIRQALLDKFGTVGTKKAPGTLYGCKSHAWAALAVAVTAMETRL